MPSKEARLHWVPLSRRSPKGAPRDLFWYQPRMVRSQNYSLEERVIVARTQPGPRTTTHWAEIPNLPENPDG